MTLPSVQELKDRVCAEIDRREQEIVGISDHIMRNPETGYREHRTAAFVASQFERMGLTYRSGLALTGVKARMAGGRPGPTVAIMGELDSLLISDHPLADPITGAAHACGHNAMIGSMIGAGFGLQTVMEHLGGDVVLFAVPAEEGIELDYRLDLRDQGLIEFMSGKPELVRLGEFDDVDMAMITHTADESQPWITSVGATTVGLTSKRVRFIGKAAHAGAWPEQGVNALKAATLAMTAMDFQRETFRDQDSVRVHWTVVKGGEAVSAVPADVQLEVMVRGRTLDAMVDASEKVDRSLRAGAIAMGCTVEIESVSGVLPMDLDPNLKTLMYDNQVALFGAEHVNTGTTSAAGTDVGDLSHIMPVIQPLATGVRGAPHSNTYYVTDHVIAAVNPAKYMAMTIVDLLYAGAEKARWVLAEAADSKISKDELLRRRRQLDGTETYPL
jgi:amidohydrolase